MIKKKLWNLSLHAFNSLYMNFGISFNWRRPPNTERYVVNTWYIYPITNWETTKQNGHVTFCRTKQNGHVTFAIWAGLVCSRGTPLGPGVRLATKNNGIIEEQTSFLG